MDADGFNSQMLWKKENREYQEKVIEMLGRGQVIVLSWVVTVGLVVKVRFKKRLEDSEGVGQAGYLAYLSTLLYFSRFCLGWSLN